MHVRHWGGESGEGVSYRMELYAMLGSERARTSILHMLCPFLREPCVDELIGVCTTNVQLHLSLFHYISIHTERTEIRCFAIIIVLDKCFWTDGW